MGFENPPSDLPELQDPLDASDEELSRPGTNSDADVAQLVEDHLEYCRALARRAIRRFPSSVDVNDIFSEAAKGLWEAAKHYDPNHGTRATFKTFAYYRISFAIADFARKAVKGFQRMQDRFEDAADRYTSEMPEQLPAAFGTVGETRTAALEISRGVYAAYILSMDALKADIADTGAEDPEALAIIANSGADLWRRVNGAVAGIDSRLPEMLAMLYRDDCSMEEVGRRFQVNRSTICRLHKKALDALRGVLAPVA